MNPETLGKMISGKKRVLILRIVGEHNSVTAARCYQLFKEKYDSRIRREVVYRELECLREGDILVKCYDETEKKLCYSLKIEGVYLDLRLMKVTPASKK